LHAVLMLCYAHNKISWLCKVDTFVYTTAQYLIFSQYIWSLLS